MQIYYATIGSVVVVTIGLLLFLYYSICLKIQRKARAAILKAREIIPISNIYEEFNYEKNGIEKTEFEKLFSKIATILHVEAGRLRPSDEFNALRGATCGLFSDLEDMDELILEYKVSKQSLNTIKTIHDLILACLAR